MSWSLVRVSVPWLTVLSGEGDGESMGGAGQAPKPWLAGSRQGCPVEPRAQRWIESSLRWCAGEFGAKVLKRDAVLPTVAFLPAAYAATDEQIEALVRRACLLMMIDPAIVKVDLFDASGGQGGSAGPPKRRAVGHFRMESGRAVIGLDRSETGDPSYLTAIVAHELGHVRLLGEGRITTARADHERLTDLVTVYFGFGVFTTNAALSYARSSRGWSVHPLGELDERTLNAARNDGYSTLGYLSEHELAYALACYCWLRGDTHPPWLSYVDVGPRATLKQGLAYLAQAGPGKELPTQRTVGKTSRHGNATIRVVPAGAEGSAYLRPDSIPRMRATRPRGGGRSSP